MAEDGNLLAFADDLIIMVETKEEAIKTIEQLESLEKFGVIVNCNKTQIMTDRPDMKDVAEIRGIKLKENIQYLV